MKIKSDIQLYVKGNAAAEMRLAAFIAESQKKLNLEYLSDIVAAGGRLAIFARAAISKIQARLADAKKQAARKAKIKGCVDAAERAGIFLDPSKNMIGWLNPLKEAANLRWQVKADQEMYNIDLRIRRMLDIARRLGVSV